MNTHLTGTILQHLHFTEGTFIIIWSPLPKVQRCMHLLTSVSVTIPNQIPYLMKLPGNFVLPTIANPCLSGLVFFLPFTRLWYLVQWYVGCLFLVPLILTPTVHVSIFVYHVAAMLVLFFDVYKTKKGNKQKFSWKLSTLLGMGNQCSCFIAAFIVST